MTITNVTEAEAEAPSRTRTAVRDAIPAIGVYIFLRLLSLEFMAILARYAYAQDPTKQVYPDGSTNQWRGYTSSMDALFSWDARWYMLIAGQGVEGPVGAVDENGVPYLNRLMFFPLYPWLARPFAALPFVSPMVACLIVSAISAVAAAWGLYLIGRHVHDHRVGIMLVAAWAVAPAALTQNGGFSESLFTALSAWALYAVLKHRWLLAGLLAGLSGLSRPTAAALIGVVGLAALIAAIQRKDGWRPYAAMLLAPAGLLAYVGYAGSKVGGISKYFEVHSNTFGAWWDYGESTTKLVWDVMLGNSEDATKPIRVLNVLVLFGFILLMVMLIANKAPWVLSVFAVATFVLSVGSHAHISMMSRHLLPAFTVLLVPALAMSRMSNRNAAILLVTLGILSGWYAGWLPFISGQAI
ncbi:dolichyl-phosphate-mannose-protein mannosyltransferase [Actinoplanes lutulentus]|uniref:Dolichyl-phosphate-mannose-protein mannosyltransferase n=1 Tax=Actinoplanes lutulentus TaxID=1287878 RepID=A0A327ZLU5_9ACTN|nr:dolichyl-phosphate-mannose-protein mannosyltransferase [Actinoplanes lutulentus]